MSSQTDPAVTINWKWTHLASDSKPGHDGKTGYFLGSQIHWKLSESKINKGARLVRIGDKNVLNLKYSEIKLHLDGFLRNEQGPIQRNLTFKNHSEIKRAKKILHGKMQYAVDITFTHSHSWKIKGPSTLKNIKSASNGKSFRCATFTMAGFRWFLQLWPNGRDVNKRGNVKYCLILADLLPKIKVIKTECKWECIQAHKFYNHQCLFSSNSTAHGWSTGTLKTVDLQKFDKLTFRIYMDLIVVYDNDDRDITNQYVQNDQHSEKPQLNKFGFDLIISRIDQLSNKIDIIQQKMNDMELKINKEQKHNDNDRFDEIMMEIQLIRQNMNRLSQHNGIDIEPLKLKLWLENQVKLPDYYTVFIHNGIEDLITASLLTMETIKTMGIDKIGHQIKILNEINKLKQTKNI